MDWATERGHAEVVRLLRGGDEAGASEVAVDESKSAPKIFPRTRYPKLLKT